MWLAIGHVVCSYSKNFQAKTTSFPNDHFEEIEGRN